MGIIDIVEIGKQGLSSNREALQTTSNNIANANTPGYSRQRTVMHANENSQVGSARMGGVQIKDVIRVHDGFVQTQLLEESKAFGAAKMRSEGMTRLEDLLHGEPFRLGEKVTKFFSDFRELSANPETSVLRNAVAESARSTAEGFRTASNSLQNLRSDIDLQVDVQVQQINSLTKELASLNGELANLKARGETPLEVADRREEIMRQLATKFGFQTATDDQDHSNIVGPNGLGTLVNGTQSFELTTARTAEREGKSAGALDIFIKDNGNLRRVTQAITEGEVGGMLHVRDAVIAPTLKHLDEAAYQFATTINGIHREGVGLDGIGERDLFKVTKEAKGAAELLDIADSVKKSAETIAVGLTVGAAGDNRTALKISELQAAKIFSNNPEAHPSDKPKTINESLDGLVGTIGVQTQSEKQNLEHQEAVMNQLENYRRSISGVNLDEEAINMMQYQSVFNASAKAMKLGDELLQTVLSIK